MPAIKSKLRALKDCLRKMEPLLVAFSGGLDSSLLAVAARQVLGNNILAVTIRSPALSTRDLQDAKKIARAFGIRHRVVCADDLRIPHFTANPENRCYYCKFSHFTLLKKIARSQGFKTIADGTNADDLNDFRPGLKAASELGIKHPLQECGFAKRDIRRAARLLDLAVADKPASPCLASRFPYGTPITRRQLRMLDILETKIRSMGFSDCRARVEARGIVRIEIPENEIAKSLDNRLRKRLLAAALKAGFRYAALDLAGLRSGNLNK
ncbi:MAG: ATP-dependent sacrificial sulfur transferase LarE [Kiritimatiellia bacterium]